MAPDEGGSASATEAAPTTQEATAAKLPTSASDDSAAGGARTGEHSLLTLQQLNARLRDQGIAAAAGATDAWTRACWQVGIAYWASTGFVFTSDEVRALGVPDPGSNGAVGAQFMAAARAGVIRPVGFVQSRRPSRHAAWLRQWVGGEAA